MNLFKKHWKNILLVILVLLLLGAGAMVRQGKFDLKIQRNIAESILKDSVEHFTNKEGELIAQKKTLEIDVDNLQDNLDILGIDNEKLKDQVGNLKNLNNRLEAKLQASGTITIENDSVDNVTVTQTDSTRGDFIFNDSIHFDNGFLKQFGTYNLSGNYVITNRGINFSNLFYNQDLSYIYNVTFTSTTYWNRDKKWQFWKSKTLVTDIHLTDPNALVTDMQTIEIIPPPKKFYQKTWFWMAIGFAGGVMLVK